MLNFISKKGISHRGLRHHGLVENTLESFALARKFGFLHLETDLRCSADGKIFLSHDSSLERLGGGKELIHQLSSQALSQIKLAQGCRLARFEDLVQEFTDCRFIFDIKPESGNETIQSLLQWVKHNDANDWLHSQARFLFWRPDQQQRLAESLPGLTFLPREFQCWRAGLSVLAKMPWLGNIKAGASYAVPYKLQGKVILNAALVRAFHQKQAKVLAYLPPADERILQAIDAAGADEILLDAIPES